MAVCTRSKLLPLFLYLLFHLKKKYPTFRPSQGLGPCPIWQFTNIKIYIIHMSQNIITLKLDSQERKYTWIALLLKTSQRTIDLKRSRPPREGILMSGGYHGEGLHPGPQPTLPLLQVKAGECAQQKAPFSVWEERWPFRSPGPNHIVLYKSQQVLWIGSRRHLAAKAF